MTQPYINATQHKIKAEAINDLVTLIWDELSEPTREAVKTVLRDHNVKFDDSDNEQMNIV